MFARIVKSSTSKHNFYRNLASTSQLNAQATDPIQNLFITRIREYGEKSKKAEAGLVDAPPEILRSFKESIDRIDQIYGAKERDMMGFPQMKFKDDALIDPRSAVPIAIPDSRYALQMQEIADEQEDVSNDMEIYN